MQIIPDPVFSAIMTLPFLVALGAMWVLFFKPYRAYLDEREGATVGARREAEKIQAQAEAQLTELESRLAHARGEAGSIRAEHRQRGLAYEQQVLEEARVQADQRLAEALQQIAADAEVARASIRDTARTLSNDVAEQILGRSVPAGRA